MLQSWKNWCWKLELWTSLTISGAIIALSGNYALAQSQQIVRDSTLGAESSIVTPNVDIDGIPGDKIDGGAPRGENLFHSFEKFSVSTGSAAYFNNALNIQNIISRVTGGSISDINGLLKANGTANLFLLNPNGIVFGPDARLNIGGSFLGSTASSLNFADGTQFNATAPQTTPLLTISVPIGLQFGGGEGSIVNRPVVVDNDDTSVGLQVAPGKTLALVGGDVTLEGSSLTAPAGRIELGSVAGPSLVSLLTPTTQGWTLGYEGVQNFRDIKLSQAATVDATGEGGGDIQVQGKSIILTDGSEITAFTVGALKGKTLAVNASESVELIGTIPNGQVLSGLRTDTTGSGDAGPIRITTSKLIVRDGARVSTSTSGIGQGGKLEVNASDSVELSGTAPNSGFNSGLFAVTRGPGDAGDLKITAGQLLVQNRAEVATETRPTGTGNAGNIDITARSIVLNDQGRLTAVSRSRYGVGGNISLQVQDLLLLRRESLISTSAGTDIAGGNDGNITINAPIIVAVPSENSDITADAFRGQGGNVEITAQGIFGTQFVEEQIPESDINASGEVRLYTPDVEPSNGLVTLPAELVDVARLIVQGCQGGGGTGGSEASEFIVTGRGGLPPTPREALGSEPALVDLGTPVQRQENRANAATSINPTDSKPVPLVEAQGWVIGSNGEVVLTAQAPNVTPHSPWLTPTNCYGS